MTAIVSPGASPEGLARAALLATLRGHAPLMALLNHVDDGTAGQLAAPYATLGDMTCKDWGTKSHEGRELVVTLSLYARGGDSIRIAAAMRAAGLALKAMPGAMDVGQGESWQIVSAVVIAARLAGSSEQMKPREKGGGWSAQIDVRLRIMAV